MSRAAPPVYFVQVYHWEVEERSQFLCRGALPGPTIPNDPDSVHSLCIAKKSRHDQTIQLTENAFRMRSLEVVGWSPQCGMGYGCGSTERSKKRKKKPSANGCDPVLYRLGI